MKSENIKRLILAGAALAVLAAAGFFCYWSGEYRLILQDVTTRSIAYSAPVVDGADFSVSYTHSVNKSDVEEYYQVKNYDIYLTSVHYSAFGAGMTTDAFADGGKTLRYDDGVMIIDGYQRLMPSMVYNVGRIADHILHINGQLVHLAEIAEPGTALAFSVEYCPLWFDLFN